MKLLEQFVTFLMVTVEMRVPGVNQPWLCTQSIVSCRFERRLELGFVCGG
ncbi:MAG: hypothetical protein MK106_02395 [Mariniblastus sp.]|nr:hypothetical protein [Mariniblastus sp.]